MHIPTNLRYTTHHLWLRPVGRNDIYVGITDFAQKELGRIDSFELEAEGTQKIKDASFGKIFGANKTLELITPLAGRIVMVNTEIEKAPLTLNSDPYQHWIALMAIDSKHFQGVKLLTAEEYKNRISKSMIKL
jgi:glycine cleavage system H protein